MKAKFYTDLAKQDNSASFQSLTIHRNESSKCVTYKKKQKQEQSESTDLLGHSSSLPTHCPDSQFI